MSINVPGIQATFRKQVADYAFYLDYIGLFETEFEEVTSAALSGYDSSFDNNFINGLRTIVRANAKMTSKESTKLGDPVGVFGSFKAGSYYCCSLDNYILLLILKPNFNNIAFLQEVVGEALKKIRLK